MRDLQYTSKILYLVVVPQPQVQKMLGKGSNNGSVGGQVPLLGFDVATSLSV